MIDYPKVSQVIDHIEYGDRLILYNNRVYKVLANEIEAINTATRHKINIKREEKNIKAIIRDEVIAKY